jgi:hypothetical protein
MDFKQTSSARFMPLSRRREGMSVFDRFDSHNRDQKFMSSHVTIGRDLVGAPQDPYRTVVGARSVAQPFSSSRTRVRAGTAPNTLELRRKPRDRRRR